LVSAQRGTATPSPPQSTSVSVPFLTVSVGLGAAHTLLAHTKLAQSLATAQPLLGPQGVALLPPQSMSVSSPFLTPSLGAGSTHLPKSQTSEAHCAGASQTVPAGRSLSGSGGAVSAPASVPPLEVPELELPLPLLLDVAPLDELELLPLAPVPDDEALAPLEVCPELESVVSGHPTSATDAPNNVAKTETVVPVRPTRCADCMKLPGECSCGR
jgi:hypothetical protein